MPNPPQQTKGAMKEIKRQIAYKCSIIELISGVFIKKTGWESSFVMTDYGDFSRVNLIAVIVGKDEKYFTIDDGTGKINARFFENAEEHLEKIDIGDLILLIGRPREFNNEIYINPEIIKKITNKEWITHRRKELTLYVKIRDIENYKSNIKIKTPEPEIVQSVSTLSSKEKIVKIISDLDEGNGVDIDTVIKLSKTGNAENLISDMIMKGELFEIKPGKLKLL